MASSAPPERVSERACDTVKLIQCQSCQHWCTLRPLVCPRCGSSSLALQDVTGNGYVKSLTVIHRAPDPVWRLKVPYAVALVSLDQGPVLMGHVAPDVQMGDRVCAQLFEHEGQQLVCFVKSDRAE